MLNNGKKHTTEEEEVRTQEGERNTKEITMEELKETANEIKVDKVVHYEKIKSEQLKWLKENGLEMLPKLINMAWKNKENY